MNKLVFIVLITSQYVVSQPLNKTSIQFGTMVGVNIDRTEYARFLTNQGSTISSSIFNLGFQRAILYKPKWILEIGIKSLLINTKIKDAVKNHDGYQNGIKYENIPYNDRPDYHLSVSEFLIVQQISYKMPLIWDRPNYISLSIELSCFTFGKSSFHSSDTINYNEVNTYNTSNDEYRELGFFPTLSLNYNLGIFKKTSANNLFLQVGIDKIIRNVERNNHFFSTYLNFSLIGRFGKKQE